MRDILVGDKYQGFDILVGDKYQVCLTIQLLQYGLLLFFLPNLTKLLQTIIEAADQTNVAFTKSPVLFFD